MFRTGLRKGRLLLGTALLLNGCSTKSEIAFGGPIVVDGNLREWGAIEGLRLNKTHRLYGRFRGRGDLQAELKFVWNARGLYVACQVRDDHVVAAAGAGGKPWGDHLEVELHIPPAVPGADTSFYRLRVGPQRPGAAVWVESNRYRPLRVEAIEARGSEEGGRLSYEIRFPWSALAPANPFYGQALDLRVQVSDYADEAGKPQAKALVWPAPHRSQSPGPGLEFAPAPPGKEVLIVSPEKVLHAAGEALELRVGFAGADSSAPGVLEIRGEAGVLYRQALGLKSGGVERVSWKAGLASGFPVVLHARLRTGAGTYQSPPFVAASYAGSLAVLYTANTLGYVQPCECNWPRGGMARRSTAVARVRAREARVLLVSAGDFSEQAGRRRLEKSRFLLRLMGQMGYQAVGLGRRDLAVWEDHLAGLRAAGVRVIATNASYRHTAPVPPVQVEEAGGLPVALYSFIQAPPSERWRFASAAAAYRRAMQGVPSGALPIALVSGSVAAAEAMAASLPEVRLWLLSSLDQVLAPRDPARRGPAGRRGRPGPLPGLCEAAAGRGG